MIPRTIHHIWVGPDPLPDAHRPWVESWRHHHPTWKHRLWMEKDLPADPIRPEVLERLRAPVERADILRLEILYRFGGVYVDTDLECLRPMDDVIGDDEFVGVCLKPGRVTNTLIASVPGHPFLERALRELQPMDVYYTETSKTSIKNVAGPTFLQSLVQDYPDLRLLEPPLLFPATPQERAEAVAVHHMARTWHNVTALRTATLQAERRLEGATVRLRRERRRHAAAKKRLAKLEGRLKKRRFSPSAIRAKLGALRRSN